MKIAYIGYDLSCTKTSQFFKQQECEVTYFLKEKDQNFNYKPFSSLEIYIDHLTVPGLSKLRTARHNQAFKIVEQDYLELKKSLNPFQHIESENDVKVASNIFDLNLLKDLQYDGKQKKIFIEIEKKGVEIFDFVFIEAHPFLADSLAENNIKVFRHQFETEYIWSSVKFEIDYLKPIDPFLKQKMFFVVQDPLRKSLVDNWFFCDFQDCKLSVGGYLPYRQVANPEFKKFYIDRVRRFVSEKFKFIYLKDFLKSDLCTIGALESSVPMSLQQTHSVPNFMFWSNAQVANYLDQHFSKKIKNFKLATQRSSP